MLPQEPERELIAAIERTLVYARVFDGVLSERYLFRWLLSGKEWSPESREQAVQVVRKSRLGQETLVAQESSWNLQEPQQAAQALMAIPWIQSIWLTGRRAATGEATGDIDLLFLVDEDRLWLTRALVVLLALWHGRYRARRHGQDPHLVQGRWCCNVWLTPLSLSQFAVAPNAYHAREVVQAIPLLVRFGSDPTLFLQQNRWVQSWVRTGWHMAYWRAQNAPVFSSFWHELRVPWLSGVWSQAEQLAWRWQYWYLRRHQTREEVTQGHALFHPRDTLQWVQERYATIAAEYGVATRLDE